MALQFVWLSIFRIKLFWILFLCKAYLKAFKTYYICTTALIVLGNWRKDVFKHVLSCLLRHGWCLCLFRTMTKTSIHDWTSFYGMQGLDECFSAKLRTWCICHNVTDFLTSPPALFSSFVRESFCDHSHNNASELYFSLVMCAEE